MKNYQSLKCLLVPEKIVRHLRLFTESDLKTFLGILDSIESDSDKACLTLTSLANLVGISVRSVNKSALRLLAFGYIKYYPSHDKSGKTCFEVIYSLPQKKSTQEKSDLSHEKDDSLPKMRPDFSLTEAKSKAGSIYSLDNTTKPDTGIEKLQGKEGDTKGEKNPEKFSFIPRTKEDFLALEIAEDFGDKKLIPLLVFYCRKYPERTVRSVLSETKQTPEDKIKKSKMALFIYLLHKYAKTSNSTSES